MPDGLLDDGRAGAPRGLDDGRGASRLPGWGECGARGDAILALARAAFIEKGFDGASMQDLARASGMSAGNLYRYFPSKAALIEAMIARDCGDIEEAFGAFSAAPDPVAAMKAGLREHSAEQDGDEDALWAEITAAAARKPDVAVALQRMQDRVVGRIARVLGQVHGLPEDEALRRFGTHARLVFLIKHAAMSSPCGRSLDGALTELMMGTIDRLLDDALALAPGD